MEVKNNTNIIWDYASLRSSTDKSYMLRFLPYLETPSGQEVESIIGYDPRRGYGYGSWEEFFNTLQEAQTRMNFLISCDVVENIELRKIIRNSGITTTLVDEWNESERIHT